MPQLDVSEMLVDPLALLPRDLPRVLQEVPHDGATIDERRVKEVEVRGIGSVLGNFLLETTRRSKGAHKKHPCVPGCGS